MTIPVWVEQQNGKFTASVPGVPQLKATADTRDDAIRSLSQLVQVCVRRGALVLVEMPEFSTMPVPHRVPTEEEIEATREMVAEIYRQRDEEKALEFPG